MRGIRSLPLRLTLIDVRRPGEIMEDLRGFVLNKLRSTLQRRDSWLSEGPRSPNGHGSARVCFGSTRVIENSELNLRKGWKAVIRSGRLNDASAPLPDLPGIIRRIQTPKRGAQHPSIRLSAPVADLFGGSEVELE